MNISTGAPSIFDRMSALSDTTRSRLLLLLERHELTVSELCAVLQLPQSTVSRHLKVLGDEGWVVSRAEATSRYYRMPAARLDPAAQRLWHLVREQIAALPTALQDRQRAESVLTLRRSKSQEFFSSSAGEWDRVRSELFGRRADLLALLALFDSSWRLGDLGCGTGHIAAALAPFVRQIVAVDESAAMLEAARGRLGGFPNVEVRSGDLLALPIADGTLDAAVLFLVLHYLIEPARAVAEAARVLRPGGRLLIADMMPHEREDYRQQMGHVWLGFAPAQVEGWAREAGIEELRYVPLPADAAAKGPTLFAASGCRAG